MSKITRSTNAKFIARQIYHACDPARQWLKVLVRSNPNATIEDAYNLCVDGTWIVWIAVECEVNAAFLLDLIERLKALGVDLDLELTNLPPTTQDMIGKMGEREHYWYVLSMLDFYLGDVPTLQHVKSILSLDVLINAWNSRPKRLPDVEYWNEGQDKRDIPF